MAKTRINITLTIEVEPAEWAACYGCESTPTAVRTDVREYVLNAVQQQPGMLESGANVTMK